MSDIADPVERAAAVASLGVRVGATPDSVDAAAEIARADPDPRVRAAAVAALVRAGSPVRATDAWAAALDDESASVRRRACELAPALAERAAADRLALQVVARLDDADATVIEAAAWALGELGAAAARAGATTALATTATTHDDPIAREAAVAALGALGDESGLPAILAACNDKPAIRRRAVLALAPFEGKEVEAALAAAREDRDWQTQQAAEDLTIEDP